MESLIDTVESLLGEHRKLVQLLNRKKEALIKNDIELLKTLVKEEEHQALAIHSLEKERICRGELIAEKYGLQIEDVTLSKLLDLTKGQPELQSRLTKIDQEFTAVIALLRGINELNGQLITQSLRFLESTLDILTDSSANTFTYNEKERTTVSKRSFFDSRI